MIYHFEEVLNEKEIQWLKNNNLPLECERNIDSVWDTIMEITRHRPLTEFLETLTDKLQDSI